MNNNVLDNLIDARILAISDLNAIAKNSTSDTLHSKIKTVFEKSVITSEIEQEASVGSIGHFFVQKFRTLYFFFCRDASEQMVRKIARDFLAWREKELGSLDKYVDTYKLGYRFSPYLSEEAIKQAITETKNFAEQNSLPSQDLETQFKNRIVTHLRKTVGHEYNLDKLIESVETWRKFNEEKERAALEKFKAPFEDVFSLLSKEELQGWSWKPDLGEKPVVEFLTQVQKTQVEQIETLKKIYSHELFPVVAGLYLSDGTGFKPIDIEVEALLKLIKTKYGDKVKTSHLNEISDHLYSIKSNPSFYTRKDILRVIHFLHTFHGPQFKGQIDGMAESASLQYMFSLMRTEDELDQLTKRNNRLNEFLKSYQTPLEPTQVEEVGNTLPSYFFNPLALVSLFPPAEKASHLRVISRKIGQLDEQNPQLEKETFDLLDQAITYYQKKGMPLVENRRLRQKTAWDLFFNDLPILSKQLHLPLPDMQTPNHLLSWVALLLGKFIQNPQAMLEEVPRLIQNLNRLPNEFLEKMSFLDSPFVLNLLTIVDTIPLVENVIKTLIKPFLTPENLVKNKEELQLRIAKIIEKNNTYLESHKGFEDYEEMKKIIEDENKWHQDRVDNFDREFETLLYKSEKLILDVLKILINKHQVVPTVRLIKAFGEWRKARLNNKETPELLKQVADTLKNVFTQFLNEVERNPLEKKIMIEAQLVATQFHIKDEEPNKSLAAWLQIKSILRNALGVPV